MAEPRAAYIHVPFCRHRCGYCNFTLVAGRDDLIEAYLEALARELSWLEYPRPVDTLFLGGGTPTHLSAAQLRRLFDLLRRWFPLRPGYELSVEANPSDLTAARVDVLGEFGVTRLSLGAQSFDSRKLALLERDHCAADVQQAVRLAQSAFPSVSLDLIFATPGETADGWRADLERAVSLEPNHISTYGLTFERGAQFWTRRRHGDLNEPNDDTWCELYGLAIDLLRESGFEHYEVSNFARPGHRCRHNEFYWNGDEYFAAGPGAARYVGGRREVNHRSTTTYIARVLAGQSPVAEAETLSAEDRARERLVLGLRQIPGVAPSTFQARTGYSLEQLGGPALVRHLEIGTLEFAGGRLRLTRAGLFVSDAIWPDFLRQ